jgi:glutathione peroxidase
MRLFVFSILTSLFFGATNTLAEDSTGSFFDLTAKSISGEERSLSEYKGKVLLVVNIASQCGFTTQLGDLERLYQEYKAQGFEVLGFPSNDFGGQEPLDNKAVKTFCNTKYGVTFPLFEKGQVSGTEKQTVYKFLTESKDFMGDPGWNFVKFIIGKDGKVRDRFSSMTNPLSSSIKRQIEALLKEPQG